MLEAVKTYLSLNKDSTAEAELVDYSNSGMVTEGFYRGCGLRRHNRFPKTAEGLPMISLITVKGLDYEELSNLIVTTRCRHKRVHGTA